MNQSESLAIARNLLKALGKSRVQNAIGFGFGFALGISCKISIVKMLRVSVINNSNDRFDESVHVRPS